MTIEWTTKPAPWRTAACVAVSGILAVTGLFALLPQPASAQAGTLDLTLHDLFDVPLGGFEDYWQRRWEVYRRETVLRNVPPYLLRYAPNPIGDPGNFFVYGNCRMTVRGVSMPEMSVDAPVVLPRLGRTNTAGGFADVSLTMAFLTRSRWDALRAQGYGLPDWIFNDGYTAELRGTVRMDALGAQKVLGLKGDPIAWWAANEAAVEDAWSAWLADEANDRLGIWSAFRFPFAEYVLDLTLTASGPYVVLDLEEVSLGIDALVSRWMYWGTGDYLRTAPAGILPFEGRYDHFGLFANLTTTADLWILTDIDYCVRAWAGTGTVGADDAPVWVWQPTLLDVLVSTPDGPSRSELDAYREAEYVHLTPGSPYYGRLHGYEFVPAQWSLDAGEVLRVVPPWGPVLLVDPPAGSLTWGPLRLVASSPAVPSAWDPWTRRMTLVGPLSAGGGADLGHPWLEFGFDPVGPSGSDDRKRP